MKPQIICAFLVLLLITSITACSSSKSGSDMNTNDTQSSNQVSSTSNSNQITVSDPSTTPPSASDNKSEIKSTQSPPNSTNTALKAYKTVLQNNAEFYSTNSKDYVYLNDFLINQEIYGAKFKVTHFAVLDMDGDKVPEVVLELTVDNDVQFYEILHYMNNEVYGYIQVLRGFENLKTDGTFIYSNGAFDNGYGRLKFQTTTSEMDTLGCQKPANNDNTSEVYFINNEQVTSKTYDSFVKEQDGKKDAVWYEFSSNSIDTVFSANELIS